MQNRPIFTPELTQLLCIKAAEIVKAWIERQSGSERPGYVGDDRNSRAPDPYRVLGLRPSANAADVRRRVRELARIFHPDHQHGDSDKMTEINEAAAKILSSLKADR